MKRANLWTTYRTLPEIVQLALVITAVVALGLLVPRPAKADEEAVQVRARAHCEGGRLVAIELFAPVPGVITIPIPPDVCQRQPQADQPAPKQKRPALTI